MRVTPKLIAFYLLAAALFSGAFFGIVAAQGTPMTEDQMGRIRSSCVSAKNTLNQLHANDALLRVNRGQMYESMSTKLMARFNARADSNHLNVKNLTIVAQDYDTTLTKFRDDYKSYEEQLYAALNIDCSKEPVSFYDAIAIARTQRAQVHTDVIKLHQYIDGYQAAFDALTTEFNKNNGAAN
jgi:hypothetical protein